MVGSFSSGPVVRGRSRIEGIDMRRVAVIRAMPHHGQAKYGPAVRRRRSVRRTSTKGSDPGLGHAAPEQLESIGAAAAAKLGWRPEHLLVERDIVSADHDAARSSPPAD
jgi:predicted N-acyltransferase